MTYGIVFLIGVIVGWSLRSVLQSIGVALALRILGSRTGREKILEALFEVVEKSS